MDVGPPFVTSREAAEAAEPGERALHDPAVPPETLAAVHSTSGDPGFDPAPTHGLAAAGQVIGLVGVELGRPLPGSPTRLPDQWHRVD